MPLKRSQPTFFSFLGDVHPELTHLPGKSSEGRRQVMKQGQIAMNWVAASDTAMSEASYA
jgi:hypothetical protein